MKKHVLFLSIFTLLLLQVAAQAQIITTVAGTGSSGFYGEGIPATDANIMGVRGMAIDKMGNLYIVDRGNNRIRKISTDGIITTIAGNGMPSFSGDGGIATNATTSPTGITVDDDGNIYISGDNRVRKITTSGIISTIAGTGEYGYNGDNIPATAAKIWGPDGLVIDKNGNLYIADAGNSRIRKVSSSGIITTVAGTGVEGYNGDNILALAAQLGKPSALAIDNFNRLYIGDQGNFRIRRINKDGIISTIAGIGTSGYIGDGGLAIDAKITGIGDIVFDKYDNIYFSDPFQHCVRKIDQLGVISTIAGTGESGFSGDGGLAVLARVHLPHGLAINQAGGMYIAAFGSKRVRFVSSLVSVQEINLNNKCISVYPNPSNGSFNIQVSTNVNERVTITITDILGRTISRGEVESNKPTTIELDAPTGVYVVRANTDMWTVSAKVLIQH